MTKKTARGVNRVYREREERARVIENEVIYGERSFFVEIIDELKGWHT